MDGTFNQFAPLDWLVGSDKVYSFDLKSATNRWPLVYLFEIVALLLDRSFASSVVNSTLATNSFRIPFVRGYRTISFVAGQPLGDYGSWPLNFSKESIGYNEESSLGELFANLGLNFRFSYFTSLKLKRTTRAIPHRVKQEQGAQAKAV